ncbi:MAG: hypothetical protein J1E34_08445, partial [Oscillospiraceae bacterium]|nr:hypothetical protein [Oscillospiraceae bacterium]
LTLEGLGSGEYTVSVIAENAYGGQSQPIETTVTVEGKSAIGSFFDRAKIWLKNAAQFIIALF